jgi:hypothetical protein
MVIRNTDSFGGPEKAAQCIEDFVYNLEDSQKMKERSKL